MIALRSASSGWLTVTVAVRLPPLLSTDRRAAASSRAYCGASYLRSGPRSVIGPPSKRNPAQPITRACSLLATLGVHIVPQLLTVLRTAFLVYVRVLLFLQGLFLVFLVWAVFSRGVPIAIVLVFSLLGLAQIVTALLLRRGRRWAAISAILIEALWALAAAALGYKTIKDWPLNLQLAEQLTAVTALFLVTIFGLALRPVRAYAGLVRR